MKSSYFYKLLKKNKFIFSFQRRLLDKDYILQKKKMKYSKVKSSTQIKWEMAEYAKYWNLPADDYIRYGLFEKNLTLENILDYIPKQFFYCNYLEPIYKEIDTNQYDDKWVQHNLFKKLKIPTPSIVALIKRNNLFSLSGTIKSFDELKETISENEKLFIKPTKGKGGMGIIVIKKLNNQFLYKGKIINNFKQLNLNKRKKYIVQRGIIQRKDINAINKSSVNTLRVITQYNRSTTRICSCLMRIGQGNAEVDNSHLGGLSIQINLENGKFIGQATTEHGGKLFDKHPDNGFQFNNNGIKNWLSIKKQILEHTSKLSQFKNIGWDIAIVPEGIVIIEFNFRYALELLQNCNGGMRKILHVYPQENKLS